MCTVVQELRLRGHENVLAQDLSMHFKKGQSYSLMTFPVTFSKDLFHKMMHSSSNKTFDPETFVKTLFDMTTTLKNVTDMYLTFCTDLVYEKELMKSLDEAHYEQL